MKSLTYLLFVILFGVAIIVSCTKNKDTVPACSVAWASDLQDEIIAISNAGTAYASDPTEANCNAYKTAYQAYINALEPYGNCAALTGQQRADFEEALQDARDSLSSLC